MIKCDFNQNNNIDFAEIEKKLGFEIHSDLKEFYTKNTIGESEEIDINKKFLEKSINHGNWFNESKRVYVDLYPNVDLEKFPSKFINNFNQLDIYGNENYPEKRYLLGFLFDERGQMNILFNNENGNVEWCDFEYGADKWSENPRGVITNSIREFVDVLNRSHED